jgi:hypothetical protein
LGLTQVAASYYRARQIRNRRPSVNVSETKSNDQRWFTAFGKASGQRLGNEHSGAIEAARTEIIQRIVGLS